MSRVSTYRCDMPDCDMVVEQVGYMTPKGWVYWKIDRHPGGPGESRSYQMYTCPKCAPPSDGCIVASLEKPGTPIGDFARWLLKIMRRLTK